MRAPDRPVPTDADLDEMQWVADPEADRAVAAILGPWSPAAADGRDARIRALNAVISSWQDNADVAAWRADPALRALGVGDPLEQFLAGAQSLPAWVQPRRLERAERLFMDYGALSVTILFCASLPECYVVPDLAAVLHATGQLEDRAEYRIRRTGAMIFPVMMKGGLTSTEGAGIAQVLKVRLIHATVRNLILRDSPEAVAARARAAPPADRPNLVPALATAAAPTSPVTALHAHGWDFRSRALPNNQEELAYTLLTFSYVFLRGMRRLGIRFTEEQEMDYLHAWNVAGHVLGIRREMMVDTMAEAGELFARMQARGRAQAGRPGDACQAPRRLAAALMDAMKTVMPDGPFKSFPILLARRLMEPASVRDLGLDGRVSWYARWCFRSIMEAARGVDAIGRALFRDFSLCRLITRAIGYPLVVKLLMDETRKLSVPDKLRPGVESLIAAWGTDPKASSRLNAFEDRLTTAGDWKALKHPAH